MGPYLSTPNKEKDSTNGESSTVKWGATSMQGWRKSQEDAHIAHTDLDEDMSLFGVFDGHGGKEVSIFVEKVFKDELVKLDSFKAKDWGKALSEAFKKMDDMLQTPEGKAELKRINTSCGEQDPFSMANRENSIANFTGCTATVVLVTKTDFWCANAGDSRSILARSGQGNLFQELSFDHKPDNEEEKKRIMAAGGFVEENRVNGSLNLSRSIGDFEYKSNTAKDWKEQMVTVDPEVTRTPRQQNDQFLMLACDGIWDCLTSEEGAEQMRNKIKEYKGTGTPLSTCIEEIFDQICATDILSSSGIGTDNMTCVVVELKR